MQYLSAAEPMKILVVHNQYQQRGGEDIAVARELELLNRNHLQTDTFFQSNDRIQGATSKLKTAIQSTYSHEQKAALSKKIASFKPDVVHVHNFFPILTPSVFDACIEANVPVVQTLHNYRMFCSNGLFLRDHKPCELCLHGSAYNAVRFGCYRQSRLASIATAKMISTHRKAKTWQTKVTHFIASSEFSKSKFIEGGVPTNRISVKPNFAEDLVAPEKKEELFSKQRFKNFNALFVGRLSPEKGIGTLLQAWKALPFSLNIVGSGPLQNDLQEKFMHLTPRVRFLGALSQKETFLQMQKASLLIVPSECYENFPLVVAEAFSLGLPVLASKIGALASILDENKTGFFFEAFSSQSLASKVTTLASVPEKLEVISRNCRAHFEEQLSPQKNFETLMSIYKRLL